MNVSFTLKANIESTFRTNQIAGIFDVSLTDKGTIDFNVEIPEENEDWQVGAIVGPSGSGKSVVARHVYGDSFIERSGDWSYRQSVVDGFDDDLSFEQITSALTSVGFSSPPQWALSYHVLSNGQKFRCDLARELVSKKNVIAYDEFTSVVDRTVAKCSSVAVSKLARRQKKKFVAVTCHYDVLEWLEPDWVLDMASGKLARGRLRRPKIEIEIRKCERSIWRMFENHHYLSSNLHKASRCFIATWNGIPVGFAATIHNFGHKGRRIFHRVVVLPDYQGVGIGSRLIDSVADIESEDATVSIVTSHPSLVASLTRHSQWKRRGRTAKYQAGMSRKSGSRTGNQGRGAISFEYHKERMKDADCE